MRHCQGCIDNSTILEVRSDRGVGSNLRRQPHSKMVLSCDNTKELTVVFQRDSQDAMTL